MITNNFTKRGIKKASEVEPIKKMKDIKKIKQFLLGKENKRDYMLFVVGINIGLRAGDLLSLKIGNIYKDGKVMESYTLYEEKTGKRRTFDINKAAREAIALYLSALNEIDEDDYLFKSRKSKTISRPLTVSSTHKIIKTTCRDLGIKGNFGTHTLRKTFAYHVYINNIQKNPTILNTLQKMLNHSSPATTLRYIGITQEVITDIYINLNL